MRCIARTSSFNSKRQEEEGLRLLPQLRLLAVSPNGRREDGGCGTTSNRLHNRLRSSNMASQAIREEGLEEEEEEEGEEENLIINH